MPATDARPVILLADDEPAVRAVLVPTLAALGYDALVAADGEEADYLLGIYDGPVAAAVLDVSMPGRDGPATLDELRARVPGLPCVFVTGGPAPYNVADLFRCGVAAVLAKPVSPVELGLALVAAVTADARASHARAVPAGSLSPTG